MNAFLRPTEKVYIKWAIDSIESSKEMIEKNYFSNAKDYILCAISYLQDARRELEKKGA